MSEVAHAPSGSDAGDHAAGKSDADVNANTGANSAIAAAAAQDTASASTGRGLDPGLKSKMEGAFGADFSAVRVHTDGAANSAAQELGAAAFAQGSDIFFDQDKYDPGSEEGEKLIAHELAHVVQQNGGAASAGPQRKATAVSAPGDAAEAAADAAAEKAVKGQPVGSVGTAPASTIHRDAIGDLRSAAEGNWLGKVDDNKVLQRARALSPADKQAIRTGDTYDSLNRRIMKKLSTGNCLEYFRIIGGWDLRWKLYWLNEGGRLDELNRAQWQWLLGYASPQTMDLLRQYPTGYRAFLRNAPLQMIPPWDRLQGLEDGTWKGNAAEIADAVVNLNPAQKAAVRGDATKMRRILAKCGDTNERFRIITCLELKVKWAVHYLNTVGALPSLTQHQWSQLLTECTRQDFDELVGWGEVWALTQRHCPPGILQVARQNSDPATAVNAFDDRVQIDLMFNTLGPAGFLATAVKQPRKVDEVYQKVQGANKVTQTVEGLPTGAQMGAATKANLRQWMFTPSATDAECQAMFERRFRVQTHGLGDYDHLHKWDPQQGRKVRNTVDLQPFTKAGLHRMWQVCETLPPAAVEGNPNLMNILRDANRGPGSAYYASGGSVQGDILVGYRNDGQLNKQVGATEYVYQADGAGPGSPAVNMPEFHAALRHEIGHAVDNNLKVMETWGRQDVAGGWIKYASWEAWVDAMIAAAGGMNYGSAETNRQYRQAMIEAVRSKKSFSEALTNLGGTPPRNDPGGPVSAVWTTDRWTGQPWYDESWVTLGTRNFHCAYGGESTLYSFRADIRNARKVTAYQWRAPGEWFAECYQVYYSETENGPGTPVGGRLRSRDPEAAQMISQICDRGFSPQDMGGGVTASAPGT